MYVKVLALNVRRKYGQQYASTSAVGHGASPCVTRKGMLVLNLSNSEIKRHRQVRIERVESEFGEAREVCNGCVLGFEPPSILHTSLQQVPGSSAVALGVAGSPVARDGRSPTNSWGRQVKWNDRRG